MTEHLTRLEIAAQDSAYSDVARALWVLEDARWRTRRVVADLPAPAVDLRPPGSAHSIGTLLYHIEATEMEWICVDLLGCGGFAPEVERWLAAGVRDARGRLVSVVGELVTDHLERMDATRAFTRAALSGMTSAEFRRVRTGPVHAVSAEWVVHHLAQHEAEHRGQIASLRAATERAPAGNAAS